MTAHSNALVFSSTASRIELSIPSIPSAPPPDGAPYILLSSTGLRSLVFSIGLRRASDESTLTSTVFLLPNFVFLLPKSSACTDAPNIPDNPATASSRLCCASALVKPLLSRMELMYVSRHCWHMRNTPTMYVTSQPSAVCSAATISLMRSTATSSGRPPPGITVARPVVRTATRRCRQRRKRSLRAAVMAAVGAVNTTLTGACLGD
mmetsp:Transcript_16821/g.37332  ORF Transcript_16821/g.37332 Transcript_16821/m.37332 type:complete len:207 (-) Transcript_16821:921-1541(-)